MSPDGAGSPAASKSILAAVFKSVGILPSGEGADGAGSHIDARDNQLDELNSQVLSVGQLALHQILLILCLGLWYKPQILFHVLRVLFQIPILL